MKKLTWSFLLACTAFSFASRSPSYELGDVVSNFSLKNVDGKTVSLADYKTSKGLIVIFDCNTCPYSKAYNDRIIDLDKRYASLGFPVITINANDPEDSPGDSFTQMISLAKKKNYKFPYLVDQTQEVAKSFGATNTPHVFILKNEATNFIVAYIGTIDNNSRDASSVTRKYVEEAVDQLLADKPVSTTKTKAIGCGIKWK
ncbi:MAG: thioredoxin family protein [Chryseolinea sp.]